MGDNISPLTVIAIHKKMKHTQNDNHLTMIPPLKQDYFNFVYAVNTTSGGAKQIDTKVQGGTHFAIKTSQATLEAAIMQRNKTIVFLIYPQILHNF